MVARGIREVLVGADPPGVVLSERAARKLADLRALHPWATSASTALVVDDHGRAKWWTFAGWKANLWLAQIVAQLRREVAAVDDLTVALDPWARVSELEAAISGASLDDIDLAPWVVGEAADGLKFSDCLPLDLAIEIVTRRLSDRRSTEQVLGEDLVEWRAAEQVSMRRYPVSTAWLNPYAARRSRPTGQSKARDWQGSVIAYASPILANRGQVDQGLE